MVFFDLPVKTSHDRREAAQFRKFLLNDGYHMIQFSVYGRVCVNKKSADFMEKRIAAIAPPEGLIQSLIMTEKQYNDMHFIAGKPKEDVRNSSERTIIL